ncbi:hypothetical protein B0H14DRAFT_3444307 [Mycena olivaceomarginata]|nr:hypothetical protein B0H14DRAFT_3444307 [Mycena olivaceomarginata]
MSASPPNSVTRTVAIIKHHALNSRFDIERRIQEASFEIVKERQMEFDVESDPDTLFELFGEDSESLGEGPVWVYVLERRRAVEVWLTLMGDRDPNIARQESPNSLRALYGTVLEKNALMGSPDAETAEIQIASLFASSPPFPTSELPDADGRYASMRSVSSSVLDALRQTTSDEGYAPSNPSTTGGPRLANGNPLFKARPLPATHAAPDIAVVTGGPSVPRAPLTKERLAKTFANVPGHKRAESIAVASTAAPTIAPRMTRAASLRLGITPPAPVRKPSDSSEKQTFDGAAPTVAPRLNKSAALRASKESGPPSSFQFRGATTPKLPGLSRSNSTSSLGQNTSKFPSRPASAAGVSTPKAAPAPTRARPSSVSVRPAPPRASILPAKTRPHRIDRQLRRLQRRRPRTAETAPEQRERAVDRAADESQRCAAGGEAGGGAGGGGEGGRQEDGAEAEWWYISIEWIGDGDAQRAGQLGSDLLCVFIACS